jgi:hypothetical protein
VSIVTPRPDQQGPERREPESEQREPAPRPRTSPPPAPGHALTLLDSFNYAFEGIIHVLRTQRNLRIHFAIAIAVIAAAVCRDPSRPSSRSR